MCVEVFMAERKFAVNIEIALLLYHYYLSIQCVLRRVDGLLARLMGSLNKHKSINTKTEHKPTRNWTPLHKSNFCPERGLVILS